MTEQDLIQAVREAVAAGETTSTGAPTVEALERRLGRSITARERDEAWEALESEEPKAEVTAAEPALEVKPESLVYVGPTLKGIYPVTQFTVFKSGTLPPALQTEAGKDRNLARMFVPVSELALARQVLAVPESRLSRAFRKILQRRMKKEV